MNKGIRYGLKLGSLIWLFAFIWATIVMILIGVDFEDESNPFGIHHDKYWLFEIILLPTFALFVAFLLTRHFRNTKYTSDELKILGTTIMVLQYFFDLIVIVFALGGGFEYFYALVTITYLTIPFFVYYLGKRYIQT